DSPAPSGPSRPPVPSRVSNNRCGFIDTNSVGLDGGLISGGTVPPGGGSPGPIRKKPRFWKGPLRIVEPPPPIHPSSTVPSTCRKSVVMSKRSHWSLIVANDDGCP